MLQGCKRFHSTDKIAEENIVVRLQDFINFTRKQPFLKFFLLKNIPLTKYKAKEKHKSNNGGITEGKAVMLIPKFIVSAT